MKNSKLIDILGKLEMEEVIRLKQFIVSPYFVKQESLANFVSIILNEYPQFEGDSLEEEILYQMLFPGKVFKESTLLKLMNQTITTIHQFLTFENFSNDQSEFGTRLLEELRKKGIGKEFQRVATDLNLELENGKKDQQHYYQLMRFENEMDIYYNGSKEYLGYSQYLQSKASALDTFYISAKLRTVCEMINRQNIFSTEYEISMLEVVLNYVEKNIIKFENHSAVSIYYRILLTLSQPSKEENYFILTDLLDKKGNEFSTKELKEMYTFAMNYCIKQLNSGRIDYEAHLFKLYRKLIETSLIYDNDYISQWDYKNIVSTSLRLAEFEWTENFIWNYKEKLHPNFRDVAFDYNLASLHYEKKEFAKALRALNQFNDALKKVSDPDFNDTFYNLDSRTMFLKIYYESDEDDTLRTTIDSFKSYLLRNKKLSERQRKIYLNLLKYTNKLNHLRQKFLINPNIKNMRSSIRYSIKGLKNDIQLDKNIVNLSWLQLRLEELEKKVG